MSRWLEKLRTKAEDTVNRIVLFVFPDAIPVPAKPPDLTPKMSLEDAVARSFLTGRTIIHSLDEHGNPVTTESEPPKP